MSSVKRKRDDLSDSEDEEEQVPGRQILPVANLPANFDGEPVDGLQYLFTVRRDARKLPHVTRAKNPYAEPLRPSRPSTTGDHPLLPNEAWRNIYISRFKNFRKNISHSSIGADLPRQKLMPNMRERDLWWSFLSGRPESEWNPPPKPKKMKTYGMRGFSADEPPPRAAAQETWLINEEGEVELSQRADTANSLPIPTEQPTGQGESLPDAARETASLTSQPREPTPSLLKHIDERMALHLLMYFTHWLNLHLQNEYSHPCLTQTHARWMFVLLAQIEDFISADDMSLLRNLVRACTSLLNRRLQKPEVDGDSMDATSCWLVTYAVVGVWSQRDLWMDMEEMLKTIPEPSTV